MYRRNAAITPRTDHRALASQISTADAIKGVVLSMLMKVGLLDQAEREHRRWEREHKRTNKHTTYFKNGLNGERAVERRRRQIAAGSLRAKNGLVA